MVTNQDINLHFLIDVVFGGDTKKALEVSREFPRASFRLMPTSVERYLIIDFIKSGVSDDEIVEALSEEDYIINKDRVKRLRREVRDGKHED